VRHLLVLVIAFVAGCGHPHGHDEDVHEDDDHQVRDPDTEPCDAANWRELLPDLRQCQLDGAVLATELLRRADLSRSTLQAANLAGADLFKVVLVDADLTDANLDGTNLTSADLTRANLFGASLRGARLTNAITSNTILVDATTDETTICPSGVPGPCW
jgi:uncharacterized protein YjbI with pentapeptide repeats